MESLRETTPELAGSDLGPLPVAAGPGPAVAPAAPAGRPLPASVLRRGKSWAKILSAYFSTQMLTQLAGIGAGLLFIHYLPVREFALYALAFSVVSFFTFLSDLGSTSSLIHFFRLAATQGHDFQSYFAAVLSLRRAAFLLGAAAIAVVFPAVAGAKGFTVAESLPVTAAIALCVWFQLNSSLRVLALRLHDRYGQSYRAELAGGLARLLLAGTIVACALLRAWLGVLSSAAAAALVTWLARARSAAPAGAPAPAAAMTATPPASPTPAPGGAAPPGAPDLAIYRRKVLRYLLPTLPSALYFAIQGPLVIWLSAAFGSTRTIAEVGALGRLGLVMGLFSGLTGVVFLPRLARLHDDRLYLTRYLQFGAFMLAIAAGLLAAAALFPGAFLFVLGPRYRGLHRELLLVVLSSGLALLDSYALGINSARSWNRWQAPALVALFAVQALAIAWLPLSSTWHLLLFNVLTAGVGFVSQTVINWIGFLRPQWVRWA
jgi:O-antigen/teichoic acid export membrane protein